MSANPPLEPTGAGREAPAANEALMQFLYQAPVGLLQIAVDGTIELINPMSARLLMPLSVNGDLRNFFDVLETVAPHIRRIVRAFDEPTGSVCDAVLVDVPASSDGARPAQVLSVSLLKLDDARLMAMVSDVTLERRREALHLGEKLSEAARVDALTRLPNRLAIRESIERAIERQHSDGAHGLAVLFINCDRFKQINDSFGHAVGDEVLKQIAQRLRTMLRHTDALERTRAPEATVAIAATLGGDEFVVLVSERGSDEQAVALARRLLHGLSQPYAIAGQQLHCTVSIGIVSQAASTLDADALLQDASIAMREAKRNGGARYVSFEPSMHEHAARRGELEIDLRRAIVERQLFVVYQPLIALQPDADTALHPAQPAHAAGVEALVRWRHPVRGVVPPVEFIPVAEELGVIGEIGKFVLATACRQFVAWQRELGALAPRLVAVNLSRAQLNDERFVAFVAAELEASGMHAGQLQLEVTESLAAQDALIQARLRELNALGVTLALDDFGTGYSSLSSLHQLPVTTVKIDRSFVSEAETSAHHRVLIEATVRVAASLGMRTVAEGIETRTQEAVVRALGCEKGQGYLYSRPLPADELSKWLVQTQAGEPDGH